MKKFFSNIFFIFFLIQLVYNQNHEYKLIKEEQGIQIFAREMECHDDTNGIHQLFYQLQFINTTNLHANIKWNIDTWMNGACITCGKPKTSENTYKIELPPNESIEGTCNKYEPQGLKVYIKQLQNTKTSVLTKFEIINLKVEFYE